LRQLRFGDTSAISLVHRGLRVGYVGKLGRLRRGNGLRAQLYGRGQPVLRQLRQWLAEPYPFLQRELRLGDLGRMERLLGKYGLHAERHGDRSSVLRRLRPGAVAYAHVQHIVRLGGMGELGHVFHDRRLHSGRG
jgi:hypothetical protein